MSVISELCKSHQAVIDIFVVLKGRNNFRRHDLGPTSHQSTLFLLKIDAL